MDKLRSVLQIAIEIEHARIPLYLCALYSLKDIPANRLLRNMTKGVVHEEMIHMGAACNLLIAAGGFPKIAVKGFVSKYDGS